VASQVRFRQKAPTTRHLCHSASPVPDSPALPAPATSPDRPAQIGPVASARPAAEPVATPGP